MNKRHNKGVSVNLSWIAIAVSLIAVIVAFSRANECISTGDTLTVLSVLVTILLGWNIFQLIDIKGKVDNFEKTAKDISNKAINNYDCTVKAYVSYLSAYEDYRNKDFSFAINGFLASISEGSQGVHTLPVKISLNALSGIKEKIWQHAVIDDEDKNNCVEILTSIPNKMLDDMGVKKDEILSLIEYLRNLPTDNENDNIIMETKFILKIENATPRYLAKDVEQGDRIVPFAFISCDVSNNKIAKFNTKEDAMAAFKEAQEYEGGLSSPVILEIIIK